MSRVKRGGAIIAVVGVAGLALAGCSQTSKKSSGKYDPKYGVSASSRVATKTSEFRKGGGVYKVGKPYKVAGRTYVPKHEPSYNKVGKASWYGEDFHGRLTANGEIFNMNTLTAAHPTLPLPSYARVTNLKNGRSVIVRINDRGPFAHSRIIDLSKRVAVKLGFINDGIANVRVKYVGKARMDGHDAEYLEASYREKGQPIGNDRQSLPGEETPASAAPTIMMASAKPARKPSSNYLLANLPQMGSTPSKQTTARPIDLAGSGPMILAPIDLVGSGYDQTTAIGSTKSAPVHLAGYMAPVQLNYASTTSQQSSLGQTAISSMFAKSQNLRPQNADGSDMIGTFQPAYAKRIAIEFAMIAALNVTDNPDGTQTLTIHKLKQGVSWEDVTSLRQTLGIPRG
ncbi:septal ring lytic transglycosylase RlpA family protein [uncultured Cohaesibacter sp.]|uniref:septal ring lytic transglycosylase RlpA family protein n=1 Tax=uncultured Cohaesibacter sp. TaxID=1002546 RepID=UPI00293164C4|nr:septal ring lytic transglycosylase RlpA family protein [uncultured Cohaesibacter sp.]